MNNPQGSERFVARGARNGLTSNHDALLSPSRLYVDPAGDALAFRHETRIYERLNLADKGS